MKNSKMSRQKTLLAIFALYKQWAGAFNFSCQKGCATCCTRSVTMTTLEGELLHEHMTRHQPELLPLLKNLPDNSPAPVTTTNQFAAACLRGEETDQDAGFWDLSPCIFLRNECCEIYPVRPFMCRGFGSRVRCDERGEAEVEPLLLSLNTVIMQCIEHLDRGRPWGNMNTVLRGITMRGERHLNNNAQLTSQPLPGFLLLPEEEAALLGQIQTLLTLLREER